MYGIVVEYATQGRGFPNRESVSAYRTMMVRQPGYRRRLALMADGWRRAVDLFLFTGPELARAALVGADWQACVAAHPICRRAEPALLVGECPLGGAVVLLYPSADPTRGDRDCRRDHLANAEPQAVLW